MRMILGSIQTYVDRMGWVGGQKIIKSVYVVIEWPLTIIGTMKTEMELTINKEVIIIKH